MPRNGMKGFEVCPHTCAPTGHCVNRSRTPLWRIEGGSLRRHLKKQLHPGCCTSCPAYGITNFHGYKKVIATPVQLRVHIPVIRRLRSISDDAISRSLTINVSELARQFPVDNNGEAVHDRDLHINVQAQRYTNEDEHSRSINNTKNPSQPAFPHRISHRAHSIGSDVSAIATPQVLRTIQKQPLIRTTFRVLYVPDPSRHVPDVSDSRIDLSFTTRTITLKQFRNASSVFPNLIFQSPQSTLEGQDIVKARVSEWLWLMMRLSALQNDGSTCFDVSYMSWSTMKDGILTWDQNVINRLLSVDCIIGGIDYTIDYRAAPYKWRDDKELELYVRNIEKIGPPLRFWPPSQQMKYAGMKDRVITDLSTIAFYNKTISPTTTILIKRGNSPIPKDTVLKRSNSNCEHHVIMPYHTEKRTWEYLLSQTPNLETWVAQEYIPTLQEFGEWRVFLVREQICHVVHTWKINTSWNAREVVLYRNLEELWGMLDRSRTTSVPINPEDIHTSDKGDVQTRQEAKQQMWSFVQGTYRSLMDYEIRRHLGTPSISVFCTGRMDIGVIERDNLLHYFVNGVERSTTASLWMDAFPDGCHGILADAIGMGIYEWLQKEIVP